MVDACSGESFDFSRFRGSGLIARSGYIGEAVSGERAAEKDEDGEKAV